MNEGKTCARTGGPVKRPRDRNRLAGLWRRFRGAEGSALIEITLSLPILLALLTGAASISMGLYSFQQLGNAATAGAQVLASEQGLTADPCATAVTSVTGTLPGWDPSKLTYTLSITDSSGTPHSYGPTTGSAFSCAAGAADMASNEPLTLTVSYAYTWLPILNFTFSPSSKLTSTQAELME